MKIDPSKTSFTNLVALVKEVNPSVSLNSQVVSFGEASAYSDSTGVSNSQVTMTATKNAGFSGSVTIRYKRLTFDQGYPSFPSTFNVLSTDTAATVLASIQAALSSLATEFTINAGVALTLPTAITPTVSVKITAKTTSKIFLTGTSKTVTLSYVLPVVSKTYAAAGNNLNTLAMLGNPTTAAAFTLTITGTIGSSSAANPALTVGALPAGSTLTIINKATVQGAGGLGAAYNAAGGAGGSAIKAAMNFTMDTSAGYVWGGGGGGGGAAQSWSGLLGLGSGYHRAGGGGGAGSVVGSAGAASATSGSNQVVVSNATAGAALTAGTGGKCQYKTNTSVVTQGGAGGGPGEAGSAGTATYGTALSTTLAPQAGGAAGKAIDKAGYTVTISAGNDTTHVKGQVA